MSPPGQPVSALIVHRSTDTILLFSIFLIPRQPAAAGITTCYHRLKKTVPHYLLLSPLLQHSQQPGTGELETTGNGAHLRLPTLASVPMVRCPAPGVPGPAGGGRGGAGAGHRDQCGDTGAGHSRTTPHFGKSTPEIIVCGDRASTGLAPGAAPGDLSRWQRRALARCHHH